MFNDLPNHLLRLIAEAEIAFSAFERDQWHSSRGAGKWVPLELLGHLIDSAANNHQRFVRALAQARLDWPGYNQVEHVAVQCYSAADPAICLALWSAYNRHIAFVIAQITPSHASTPCSIDASPDMTLVDLALDYVAHLEHHLKQLLESRNLSYSAMPWPPSDKNRQWPI